MAWLFKGKGKKKENKQMEQSIDSASQNSLKNIQILEQKISYNEKLIEQDIANAKAFKKAGNLKKARECMMKKKMREKYIDNWTKMKFNLETQLSMIPEAEISSKVFNIYKENMQIISDQFNNYNVEDFQDEIDKMKNQQDEITDITDAIANADFGLFMDEDEIEQEFNDLDCEQETQPAQMPNYNSNQSNNENHELNALLRLHAC